MIDVQELFKGPEANGNNQAKDSNARSPLVSLKRDLEFYMDAIHEVAIDVLDAGYTEYPIFVAHQHEVNVGEIILDKNDLGTNWTIQVSSIEEFVEKQIIKGNLKDKFIQNFKDPRKFMCLFVIVPEGANFVFNPYASSSDKN